MKNNSLSLHQKCPNPHCGFENSLESTHCIFCQTPLNQINHSNASTNQETDLPHKVPQAQSRNQFSDLVNSWLRYSSRQTRVFFNSRLLKFPRKQMRDWGKSPLSLGILRSNFQALHLNLKQPNLILGIILGTTVGSLIFFALEDILVAPSQTQTNVAPAPSIEPLTPHPHSLKLKTYPTISQVPHVPRGIFNYGGSICFAALVREGLHQRIEQAFFHFQLHYVEPRRNPGCNAEIAPLAQGELSFALNARPLTPAEHQLAHLQGFTLESIPVAIDGIVVYAPKSLGIESLTLPQLQAIYRGKITNWQEVGGSDLPIHIVSLDPLSNNDLDLLLGAEERPQFLNRAEVHLVRDYTTAMRKVSSTPGAISLASTAILKGQQSIKPLPLAKDEQSAPISAFSAKNQVNLVAFEQNNYPLTRRLFVTVRRDGTIQEKAGIAYANFLISAEGQQLIAQAGFVPLAGNFLL